MSMTIIIIPGRFIRHQKLSYRPLYYNAVTACPSGYLLVAQYGSPAAIHVHDLLSEELQEVGSFTHQDLTLKPQQRVRGISYSGHHEVLHVFVGGRWGVQSLHAYRVSAAYT